MKIERDIVQTLAAWKLRKNRKPLILQGARQIGKTWAMRTFGEQYFEHTAYFSFERNDELFQLFEQTKDPKRLLGQLATYTAAPIEPQKTLIIFDEIQECNDALNSLKYFRELMRAQAVVCAGSLLGVALKREGASFPVGNVDFMTLYPVSFKEFIAFYNEKLSRFLANYVSSEKLEKIPEIFHTQLIEAYKLYLCCGGMPETIVRYFENKDWDEVDVVNNQILTAYTLDFAKHIDSKDIPRLHRLWANIQYHLAKEDKKFKYAMIEKNARSREYENSVEWLVLSGLVNRVFEVSALRLPLSSCKNGIAFKLYLVDSGLLRTKFRLAPTTVLQGDRLFTEFKGILTENYVLQSLVRQFGSDIFYWTSGNQAEIEFMFQRGDLIIPVEAKSTFSTKAKSLSEYRKKYCPALSVRFSLKNVEKNADLLNLPLYLADYTEKLIMIY